jgi:hypothetical protein
MERSKHGSEGFDVLLEGMTEEALANALGLAVMVLGEIAEEKSPEVEGRKVRAEDMTAEERSAKWCRLNQGGWAKYDMYNRNRDNFQRLLMQFPTP